MQPLLRGDGCWLIYRVEVLAKLSMGSEWIDAGGDEEMLKDVPPHIRYLNARTGHEIGKNEPFRDFSIIGKCWQQTGIHGSLDKQRAIDLMHILAKYHRGRQFRVVAHLVSQMRVPLMEYTVKPRGRSKREKTCGT